MTAILYHSITRILIQGSGKLNLQAIGVILLTKTRDSQTQSATMSTASQVFATTELLEAILLELPGHDILRSQRVSRQWQATIIGSPKLQQALFMLASPKPEDEPGKSRLSGQEHTS